MKLALTAPLPPWPLPLAHFAAHLLWALREKATVFALCDAPYRVPPLFLGGVAAQPFCDLPSLLRTKAVEVPIHLIGDDPCHLSQLRFVRECPGILVLPTLSLDRLRASLAAELFFTQLPFVHGFQGESLAIVLALLSRAVLVASEADAEFLRGMVPTIEVVALAGLSLTAPDVRAVAAALQQLAKKLCAVPVAGPAAALLPESLPRVAAIVVTYNSRSIVAPCVQSLLDQDWPALDILVVDNQSADGTADFIRSQFPSVRVIDSGANLGFGGGNNLGIKSADAKYVVLLNQDAIAQRDWVGLRSEPVGPVGILLIDWPGFGASQGTPSPASILRAADGAVATLAAKLGLPVEDLCRRCGVLGHSMGAAAALHYAEQRGAVAVVLVAPFTSLLAMAQRAVGWPLCELLLHRFDNASALAALAQRPDKPPVLILHGDADTTIPLAMSRTLAAAHPGWVKLIAVPGAAHDDVLDLAWTTLRSALSMPQPTNDLPTAPPTTNP